MLMKTVKPETDCIFVSGLDEKFYAGNYDRHFDVESQDVLLYDWDAEYGCFFTATNDDKSLQLTSVKNAIVTMAKQL